MLLLHVECCLHIGGLPRNQSQKQTSSDVKRPVPECQSYTEVKYTSGGKFCPYMLLSNKLCMTNNGVGQIKTGKLLQLQQKVWKLGQLYVECPAV